MSIASSLGLAGDEAVVLQDSNKLTLRLLPCDVLARVAPMAHQVAQFEIELAQGLARSGSPVAALEPRVEPRVYERDGFAVTLWTYYEPGSPQETSPAGYASALDRLHAGMRLLDIAFRMAALPDGDAEGSGGRERPVRIRWILADHSVIGVHG